ncbi:hypothetical protein NDU88_006565 [Pleurodeles waltl]|uniref:Uncharacterized protein n=1 Tax=Pleurodeles waltl TaxID=8319 RepID=A0AAV7VQ07_PLEWA|nr:hypothetical protein NDU88_006565 [Pleurodeles waltl]
MAGGIAVIESSTIQHLLALCDRHLSVRGREREENGADEKPRASAYSCSSEGKLQKTSVTKKKRKHRVRVLMS